MAFPFRAVLIGLLIGTALFFVPFHFPFFFLFFFIFCLSRYFFFGGRRGRWNYGYRSRWDYPPGNYYDDVTPIDGYRSRGTPASKEGEKKVTVQ
jgi:hypothetical protein